MANVARGELHVHWLRRPPGVGRAPLCGVLASYLRVAPESVVIEQTTPHAKPHLDAPGAGVEFNWSHSGEHAVAVVARDLPVGIDLEATGRGRDVLALARRCFAPAEAEAIAGGAGSQRRALFALLWTAKEALVKASGVGLARGLGQVELVASGTVTRIVRAELEGGPWRVARLVPPWPDYTACVAWRGPDAPRILEYRELS